VLVLTINLLHYTVMLAVFFHICMCVCVYIYIYTDTHTHFFLKAKYDTIWKGMQHWWEILETCTKFECKISKQDSNLRGPGVVRILLKLILKIKLCRNRLHSCVSPEQSVVDSPKNSNEPEGGEFDYLSDYQLLRKCRVQQSYLIMH
jgi:hypothetical protein